MSETAKIGIFGEAKDDEREIYLEQGNEYLAIFVPSFDEIECFDEAYVALISDFVSGVRRR